MGKGKRKKVKKIEIIVDENGNIFWGEWIDMSLFKKLICKKKVYCG
jgi:hypothetical protein